MGGGGVGVSGCWVVDSSRAGHADNGAARSAANTLGYVVSGKLAIDLILISSESWWVMANAVLECSSLAKLSGVDLIACLSGPRTPNPEP